MSITLTFTELAGIVGVSVALAVTDGATISRIATEYIGRKLGVREPS